MRALDTIPHERTDQPPVPPLESPFSDITLTNEQWRRIANTMAMIAVGSCAVTCWVAAIAIEVLTKGRPPWG